MKKFILFPVLFLLSLSLAAAVDVSTSKTDYSSGETVTAAISGCAGTSIVEFLNPGGVLADIKSSQGSWIASYNTLSDSEDGKYTVTASCSNEQAQANFCVDAPGCIPPQPLPPAAKTGGGTACTPNWSCDEWSFCGPDLLQTRSCVDLNNCQVARDETRHCEACLGSWVCSAWAECSAGVQTRACYDEHFCETTNQKPALQKSCYEADPFPPPAKISTQLPPPYVPPAPAAPLGFLSKLWNNYKFYIIGGLAAIVLAVIIVLAIHFLAPKKVAYNINELKQWVRKEKEMGTSDENIRQILKQNTGWTDEEMDIAFEGSQQPPRVVSNV